MTGKELRNRYFIWLVRQIWPTEELKIKVSRGRYSTNFTWLYSFDEEPDERTEIILDELDRISFRYSPRVELDEDRMTRGYDLRDDFLNWAGYPSYYKDKYMSYISCSVLEVLVALSLDCDYHLMGDPDEPGLTAPLWFWKMILNLDFCAQNCPDEVSLRRSVDYKCDQFLDRRYNYYGQNGPFIVENPQKDMRKTDLWMQMNWWISEKFGTNEVI